MHPFGVFCVELPEQVNYFVRVLGLKDVDVTATSLRTRKRIEVRDQVFKEHSDYATLFSCEERTRKQEVPLVKMEVLLW